MDKGVTYLTVMALAGASVVAALSKVGVEAAAIFEAVGKALGGAGPS